MKQQPGWILPSLKDAQLRTKEMSQIITSEFSMPAIAEGIGQGKTYYIRTFGCQANERDQETIAGLLEEMGFCLASDLMSADFAILNTCAVRKNAEDKVFGEIGRFKHMKKERPDFVLAVCGCMAQEEGVVNRILSTYPQVDLVFGTHNLHRLPELLSQVILKQEKIIEVYSKEGEVVENLPVRRFGNHKAWVNIMYGCDKFCTYCIVPYTRGKERSRRVSDILEEVRVLLADGFQEITLLGQNVNAYGKDLGVEGGFASLLEAVASLGVPRVRFTTSHPWDFTDEMIEVIATHQNIMPYIHLPVQSGSTAMLKLMGRRYTIEEYMTLFDKIKARIPHCAFSTDIIVGFPNETLEQFQQTLDIVNHCQYDNAYTFIYSPREGTPAASMKDTVPYEEKQRRLYELNDLVRIYSNQNNQAYLHQEVEVLVDGPSKKRADIMSGYTETNKLVNFIAKDCKPGDIVLVKITKVKSWSLDGEQLA